MTSFKRPALSAVAGLAVAGCFSLGDSGGCGTGLVGNGDFQYECVSEADALCLQAGAVTSMPGAVALGARFRLRFSSSDTPGGGTIKAVSEQAVETKGATFTTLREGRIGFVAYDEEQAVDAIRVTVVAPNGLGILSHDRPFPFERIWPTPAPISGPVTFTVFPLDARGEALAGALDAKWSVDDPSVAAVMKKNDGICVVTPVATSGRTRLRVTAGGLEEGVELVIGEPLDAGAPDAGVEGADAGDPDAAQADDGGGV